MVITIHVDEGRQYRIGDITITGCKLYTEDDAQAGAAAEERHDLPPVQAGQGRGDAWRTSTAATGYLDTRVRLVRKPNVNTGNIDIEYQVEESEKFYVESVKIEGNTKTKSIVIIRELVLSPGDVFDTVRMKASKMRLENTAFFEDVNLTPESTNIPGRRNLKISFKEARTGNLSFGAGYSSLERATFFAELSQSNFDLFNRHSFFQGAGQKFRLRFQIGSLSNEVVLSFEEPWLFQKELGLGFYHLPHELQLHQHLLRGDPHGRARSTCASTSSSTWRAALSLTDEEIEITNVDPTASPIIQALAGKTRTVQDRPAAAAGRPRQDRQHHAGQPHPGEHGDGRRRAGRDQQLLPLEVRGSEFIPVFRAQTQVLGLIARAGVMENYGKSTDVPYYDRWFLGGPDDLRGFEYRDVGPKDSQQRADRRQDLRHVHRRVLARCREARPLRDLLRRGLRQCRRLRLQSVALQRRLRRRTPPVCGGRAPSLDFGIPLTAR